MAGHVVQHFAECQARVVVVVPDTRSYWFPMVQLATVRSVPVAPRNWEGVFQWPCSSGNPQGWRYPRLFVLGWWRMSLISAHNRRNGKRAGWVAWQLERGSSIDSKRFRPVVCFCFLTNQTEASSKRSRTMGSPGDPSPVSLLLRVAECAKCGTENVGHFQFCHHQCGMAPGASPAAVQLPATPTVSVDMPKLAARRAVVTAAMASRPNHQLRKLKTAQNLMPSSVPFRVGHEGGSRGLRTTSLISSAISTHKVTVPSGCMIDRARG